MAFKVKRKHKGQLSLSQLETDLQFSESVVGSLIGLEVEADSTISVYDRDTISPARSLVLQLDPDPQASGPPGSTLVFRGEAVVAGQPTRVAAFRRSASYPAVRDHAVN